ncbi:MAG TPA: ABC transporter substrate-binding protein [Xanthobacteraceae bacterium]|jgi:putative ABC transport system substrate-binding protein
MSICFRRREFITALAATAGWPVAARAQGDRVRRVAAVMPAATTTPQRVAVLREELQKLGWREGRNLRLDVRTAGDAALQVAAEEVVMSAPEVIFANTGPVARVVQTRTRTIPIVFTGGGDPVESGLVSNIARPGGNTTGFANIFATLGGKYLELLKETVPRVTRVAILSNPDRGGGRGLIASVESAAAPLGTMTVRTPFRNSAEIESAIESFAAEPNGALILVGPIPAEFETIGRSALKQRLPLTYQITGEGVLISYAPDPSDLVRGAASYIDRILRGAKPGELPVQFPTTFQLVINLKTAKALGLTVPPAILLRADEVIE